jgi:ElaB/YqjD/DUF883 family membrane-anchored ribosome-binding protein
MENANEQSLDGFSPSRTATGTTESSNSQTGNITDRARELAGSAQEKLADVGSNVRERAGHVKDSLADALETGADKLRAKAGGQGQSGTLAGATTSSSVAIESDGRVAQVSNRVASGMDATADWLRQADLDGLRATVEQQVKEHPGRTLLIAAGLGYLLGKALRK